MSATALTISAHTPSSSTAHTAGLMTQAEGEAPRERAARSSRVSSVLPFPLLVYSPPEWALPEGGRAARNPPPTPRAVKGCPLAT